MKERLKAVWSFFLRFGLSAILLIWLFSRIDYKHTWAALKGADQTYLLVSLIVFLLSSIFILWRWFILLKALGVSFKKLSALKWFLIGMFCNLFLPTSVGGDVVKGLGLAKETGDRPKVFISIVLDRLTGFVGIVIVACVAFFFGRKIVGDSSLMISIASMAGVSIVLGVVLFSQRIYSLACKVFKPWPKIKDALMNLHGDIILMRGKYKEFAFTIGISVFSQVVYAYVFYLIALGLHQKTAFVYFIIFSPLVCVVTSLPSIGGLGVREMGWVYLLSKVGIPQGVALGLSLINFVFIILIGLVGGVWYVSSFSSRRLQHHQADVQPQSGNASESASGVS
ncbi:MAG: flippase-like domain-containing protein [Candidatus Omnitrophica bacterium]|nr:flippase-like domain-containing protein [Candidatus Omnitrophota bacterium]